MTRILLIDDRPQDRFLAKRALGIEFPDLILTEAGDRPQFEDALQASEYDAVVTDYQLRWADGLQIFEELRTRGIDVPVIMFTHTGSEEIAAAGLKAGLADYIVKTPSHYGRLAHAVRIAISNAVAARNANLARLRETEALRTAEEALQVKDEFLATLSHELRTPLNAIHGWLQVIQADQSDANIDRGLAAIARNTGLLTRLIADLSDVSRIVSGTLRLHVQPTSVRQIVDAVVESSKPVASSKRISIEVDVPESQVVLADPDRLNQMIWNLVSNAVKFTPQDGNIQINVVQVGKMIELSVCDSGPGISNDFLPRIFDRFSQQDAGASREHGGLGLGLAIVRHLAQMHGGAVTARNRAEGGAVFTLLLPVSRTSPAEGSAAVQDEEHDQLSGVHVLVIDDEEDARDFVGKLLEGQGAGVTKARSASEAFSVLAQERPDVLVCDLGMPREDGLTFIARVRGHSEQSVAETPALAVTAYAREEDRQRALSAGFHAYLSKPFSSAELVANVRRLWKTSPVVDRLQGQ